MSFYDVAYNLHNNDDMVNQQVNQIDHTGQQARAYEALIQAAVSEGQPEIFTYLYRHCRL